MLFELDVPILASRIFEPRQAVGVSGFAGDNIIAAITIDVERVHLCATALGELHGMEYPELGLRVGRRLFPPSIFFQKVRASIAVYIADPHAMCEPLVFAFGCDWVKLPLPLGIIFR